MDKEAALSLQQLRSVLAGASDCLMQPISMINWVRIEEDLDFARLLLTKVMQEVKRSE